MIVTIDGPAGAGKSCVSRQLARRLGFRFLDTGAMYRAVTVAAIQRAHDWSRPELLEQIADDVRIEFRDEQVLLDGRDVSREIRTPEVTGLIHYAANHPGVRRRMVELQRQVADGLDTHGHARVFKQVGNIGVVVDRIRDQPGGVNITDRP